MINIFSIYISFKGANNKNKILLLNTFNNIFNHHVIIKVIHHPIYFYNH
jgi:hypothetical protein